MKKFSSITRVNSRRISQNKKRTRIVVLTIVALIVLMVIPMAARAVVALIVAPVNNTKTWLAESGTSFPQYFRNRSSLIQEIANLQSQLAGSSGDHYTVQLLTAENERLRALLGNSSSTPRIMAGVLGRPGTLPYDSLLLDAGSAEGVMENAPVFIGNNSVIGFIRSVTKHTSLAELITTPGFTSTVYVFGPNIYTDAVGQGGGQLRVGIPQGLPLKTGDLVVLPTVASGFFGAISTIENTPQQPEQYGYVSPKIPLASIRYVAIGSVPLASTTFAEAQSLLETTKQDLFKVPLVADVVTASGTPETGTSTQPAQSTSTANSSQHG